MNSSAMEEEFTAAVCFVGKLKNRFGGDDRFYRSFLEVLELHRRGSKGIGEVRGAVAAILRDHTDLLMEFRCFLPDDASGPLRDCSLGTVDCGGDHELDRRRKRRSHDHEDDKGIEDECSNGDRHKRSRPSPRGNDDDDADQSRRIGEDAEGLGVDGVLVSSPDDREREDVRDSRPCGAASAYVPRDSSSCKIPIFMKEKDDLCKPTSELDLSDCQRCTPSYRLLPKSYVIPPASQRTELETSVLNDVVALKCGDYTSKHMSKNRYEEALFRCEEDQFELDMLIESVKATTKKVEGLIDKMQGNPESPIRIKDHLTSLNLRCIEKLYRDRGLDVMDALWQHAADALPVILTRLKQKQESLLQSHSGCSNVWAETYAKYHQRSLDYRVEQQDEPNCSDETDRSSCPIDEPSSTPLQDRDHKYAQMTDDKVSGTAVQVSSAARLEDSIPVAGEEEKIQASTNVDLVPGELLRCRSDCSKLWALTYSRKCHRSLDHQLGVPSASPMICLW